MENQQETLWDNNWQPPNTDFVPLGFVRKEPASKQSPIYVVYGGEEPKQVEAPTALMAIEQSGVETPTRVVKLGVDSSYLFDVGALIESHPAATPAQDETTAEADTALGGTGVANEGETDTTEKASTPIEDTAEEPVNAADTET